MKMTRVGDTSYIQIESDEEAEALRSPNGYTLTIGPDNEIQKVEANVEPRPPVFLFRMADGSIPVADYSGSTEHKAWSGAKAVRTVTTDINPVFSFSTLEEFPGGWTLGDREPASFLEALTGQHTLWAKSITSNIKEEEQ
jgi:hypothetical protein